MSNYTINDLRGDLAETLRKLRDGDPNMTIDKAKAISELGQTMINSAKVEVEFIKTVGRGRTTPTGFVPITHEDSLDRQERTGVTVRATSPGRLHYDRPPEESDRTAVRDIPMTGICFHCGRRLVDAVGRAITPIELDYHGNTVRTHKSCARHYRRKTPTARAITTDAGDAYADDREENSPLRSVWRRSWEIECN